jgi:proteasome accessory factor C
MLMAKAATGESLETVSRLLDLVPFLSVHQGIALDELAAEFHVTSAQMTRDLNTLWMCGLPGYTPYELIDLSFDTGFVTISNAETLQNPRSLNRDEILALLLGLESLSEDLKSVKSEANAIVLSLISKLKILIEARVGMQVQSGDSFSGLVIAQIEQAIQSRNSLKIRYHSISRDQITDRLVTPLEIIDQDGVRYLFAYCHESLGYRTFRIDRILKVDSALHDASPSTAPSSVESAPNTRVKIHISSRLRDASERLNLSDSTAFDAAEGVEFECFSQEWAVREIMSFGGALTVLSPDVLREAVRERSLRTLKGYSEEF